MIRKKESVPPEKSLCLQVNPYGENALAQSDLLFVVLRLSYHIESCLVMQIRVFEITNVWAYCELAQTDSK